MEPITHNQPVKTRNLKDGGWYWIDQKVLRLYTRRLGATGIAVYNALACFADSKTQRCFPTRKAIAQILGVSRRTVTRKIRLLEELGLVRIEKSRSTDRYLLLGLSAGVTEKTPGDDKRDASQVTLEHTNNNQLTKINNNTNDDKYLIASEEFSPKSREELLALDLAEALNNRQGLKIYLSYARKFPEPLLRRTLGEVKEVPDERIKKGRAALFHYLIRKHVQKTA